MGKKELNYLGLNQEEHGGLFNAKPFVFNHSLSDSDVLSYRNLSEAILELPKSQVFYSAGDVDVTANLDTAHKDYKPELSLEDAFSNIESAGAFIMVRQPEINPKFEEVFSGLKEDVKRFTTHLEPDARDFMLYIFIASPGSVTPFHIDRYSTFLFQLQGHKDVHVWEPWDREMITDIELEQFFSYKKGFAPRLKEGFLDKSIINHIHPGESVHIPFIAPHWIQNSDDVSVSLSIIFNTRKTDKFANSLRFNNWYRNKFDKPGRPVNRWNIRDTLKANIYKLYSRVSF